MSSQHSVLLVGVGGTLVDRVLVGGRGLSLNLLYKRKCGKWSNRVGFRAQLVPLSKVLNLVVVIGG